MLTSSAGGAGGNLDTGSLAPGFSMWVFPCRDTHPEIGSKIQSVQMPKLCRAHRCSCAREQRVGVYLRLLGQVEKKSGVSGFDGPVARPRESGENEAVDGSKLQLQIHNAKDFYFLFFFLKKR